MGTTPRPVYKRMFEISEHAGERFRERVDEEFRHRSDPDLGNLLDEKIRACKTPMTVRDPRAPKAITQLYAITMQRGTFYAVVRDATAVTVLDETQARNNFADAWKPTLNAPFADALRDMKPFATKPDFAPVAATILKSVPVTSPLDDAGIAYARALRSQRDTLLAVTAAQERVELVRAELTQAEAVAKQAAEEVCDLRARLESLALS